MKTDVLIVGPNVLKVHRLHTVVVGSGAAGLNAADCLYNNGITDIALVTEGIKMGTSRNTGSDKQTYYKLSVAGDSPDSPLEMAKDLMNGGCMHGDIALAEAAGSFKAFAKLIDLGVPFPHNEYGEYVGYKTDHDLKGRAVSAGPLTSKYMTEALEKTVLAKGIKIFDGVMIIGIITEGSDEKKCIGLVGLDETTEGSVSDKFILFNCTNVVYATGGPSGMYKSSVYPVSQTGSNGIAFEAGVYGMNVTESQYGIASVKFRWNLSGSYQQVIPRYISTDQKGQDKKEFLSEYFKSPNDVLTAVFLKGYQWPFDPKKIKDQGSSLIDLIVYNEIHNKGRRVFLDFIKNPEVACKDGEFDFTLLSDEAYEYMKKCDILFGTPLERLKKMNEPAYMLYKENGIDLEKEMLEIAVCAQHNNGGLCANKWWESNIQHFFPIGECAGTFGVYRPGGSALNSTQVSGMRAAEYISAVYRNQPLRNDLFLKAGLKDIQRIVKTAGSILSRKSDVSTVLQQREKIGEIMSKTGAHVRNIEEIDKCILQLEHTIKNFQQYVKIKEVSELGQALRIKDMTVTAYVYLQTIKDYVLNAGQSRGSYLILYEPFEEINDRLFETINIDNGESNEIVQYVKYDCENVSCQFFREKVRSVPQRDTWFETVWNKYLKKDIYS